MQEDKFTRARKERGPGGGWRPGLGLLLAAFLVVALFVAALLLSGALGVGLYALPVLAFVIVVAFLVAGGRRG